jgi:hypothetical protein
VTDPKPNLADYATTRPYRTGPPPWIESLPEWPEIHEAWASGKATQPQIRDWLIDVRGYPAEQVTRTRIAHLSKAYPRRHNANG